jgi:hypothetical protein
VATIVKNLADLLADHRKSEVLLFEASSFEDQTACSNRTTVSIVDLTNSLFHRVLTSSFFVIFKFSYIFVSCKNGHIVTTLDKVLFIMRQTYFSAQLLLICSKLKKN